MEMKVFLKKQPLVSPEYVTTVEELIETISQRSFSFEEEIDEIQKMSVVLDEHPEEALAEFNNLYASVQAYLSRVTSIIISIYREKAWWQKKKHTANSFYRKERQRLFAGDPKVKELRNKELQEARVHEQIQELVDVREYVGQIIEDLELLVDIAKEKKEDLDKVNTNLSRQQKVVESLIGLSYPISARRIKK